MENSNKFLDTTANVARTSRMRIPEGSGDWVGRIGMVADVKLHLAIHSSGRSSRVFCELQRLPCRRAAQASGGTDVWGVDVRGRGLLSYRARS